MEATSDNQPQPDLEAGSPMRQLNRDEATQKLVHVDTRELQEDTRDASCRFPTEEGREEEVRCSDADCGVQCAVPPMATGPPGQMQLLSGRVVDIKEKRAGDNQCQLFPDLIQYEVCLVGCPAKPQLRGEPSPSPSHSCSATLWHKCFAEAIGTAMIVLFGCGSVCAAILSGAQTGLWQVAVVWGFTVAIAIYCTASVSGAHLNPAISLAFALLRPHDFDRRELLPYMLAQLMGGVIGGAMNLLIFDGPLCAFETAHNITRGDASSVLTAAGFGEYFPNPGFQYSGATGSATIQNQQLMWDSTTVTPAGACFIEAWGTAVLAFVIFSLTHPQNKVLLRKDMVRLGTHHYSHTYLFEAHRAILLTPSVKVPFFIGFTVAILISVYAPLTQAGWNPARDFGPRLVAAMAGWGNVALPGPRNGFWVYIVGPFLGAPFGAALYDLVLVRGIPPSGPDDDKKEE